MLIDKTIGSISKKQIMEYYPEISKVTVERTLIDLVKTGYVKKIGSGRNTAYIKNETPWFESSMKSEILIEIGRIFEHTKENSH